MPLVGMGGGPLALLLWCSGDNLWPLTNGPCPKACMQINTGLTSNTKKDNL